MQANYFLILLFLILGTSLVNSQIKLDCKVCVDFMGDAISDLDNIIVDGGIIGTCDALCIHLPKSFEADICNVLCDIVGIKEFIHLINETDPDPIYICDELNLCSHTDGGIVAINRTTVNPPSGVEGTTFKIGLEYFVVNTTSTGQIIIEIFPPQEFPLGDALLVEGQPIGPYSVEFDIETKDQEQPFPPGNYSVVFAICAGDCTKIHRWGGVYAQVNTSFLITGKDDMH